MISPKEALKKLIDGNKRFAQNKSLHPNLGNELRNALLNGQKPFAAVLSCSDSRVPVEIIFDVGVGDIFVIRTAGHVLSKEVLGSLEYATNSLGVKLIMIMGHDNCGAVKSALEIYSEDKYHEFSDNLQSLLGHIYPAFDDLDFKSNDNLLQDAVESNVNYQLSDLVKKDAYLAKKINEKKIKLIGAIYRMDSGLIELIE
ncbi:MAG: carbonic anhydrase [bacterium]